MGDFKRDDEFDDDEEDSWEDSTFSGRDAAIFLVEVTDEMFVKSEGDESHLQRSLMCARSMNFNKIVSSSSDYVGVVLFGTICGDPSTPGVRVLQQLELPGSGTILQLDDWINGDLEKFRKDLGVSSEYSLHDALFQSSIMLAAKNKEHKLYSKRILLLTCRACPPDAASDGLRRRVFQRVEDVRDNGVTISLFALGGAFDASTFYSEVLFDHDSDSAATVSNSLDELLDRVRQKSYKKRVLGKIPFVLGDGLRLAVGVYNLARPALKPTSVRMDQVTNEPVHSLSAETRVDTGEVLHRSEVDWYLCYGGHNITFNSDEVRELRAICEPGLVLLGFQPAAHVEPLQHVQPASFIYPEETWIKGSRELFSALLQRCLDRSVVPVCRLVCRRNDTPHLVVLTPQAEVTRGGVQTTPPGFHVIYLPFADDIRQLSLPDPQQASDEQVAAARAIVLRLRFTYSPDRIENPDLQKHWRNIEALALKRDQPDEFIDHTAPNVERIQKKAGSLIDAFRELVFPAGYDPAGGATPAPKRLKLDPDSVDMSSLARDRKVHMATVPILKQFLQSVGVVVGGKKKADLVQEIYSHFEQKQ